jgi:peptide deformylase
MFVSYPDPALSVAAQPRAVDAGLLAVGERLRAAALISQAYGLAAAHIGQAAPVVIMNLAEQGAARQDLLLYNPRIVAVSAETESGNEGSVSMPGIEAEVVRPIWAEVAWQDEAGAHQQRRFTGFQARVAVHEIEQMQGVFFLSRVSRLKRDMLIKKFGKLGRKGG